MAARARAVAPAGAARRAMAQVAAADRDEAAGLRVAVVPLAAVAAAVAAAETVVVAAQIDPVAAVQETPAAAQVRAAQAVAIRRPATVAPPAGQRIEIAAAAPGTRMAIPLDVASDQTMEVRQHSSIMVAEIAPAAKATRTAETTLATAIAGGIIVGGDSIVTATETGMNGAGGNMNGVAHFTSRGLTFIPITEPISTAQTPTTTDTKMACLPARTMRGEVSLTIRNARTFTNMPAEVSCRFLVIPLPTATPIATDSLVGMKKAIRIGRLILPPADFNANSREKLA